MEKAVFLVFALASPLPGLLPGQPKCSYVTDSNPVTGRLNVVPFGTGSAAWGNQRAQFLRKKTFLPGKAGMIRSVGFAHHGSATLLFSLHTLRLGHDSRGTMGPAFQASFSGQPVKVLARTSFFWTVTGGAWSRIPSGGPFPHNGKDVLVPGSDLNAKVPFRKGGEPSFYAMEITPGKGSSQTYGWACPGPNWMVPFPWIDSYPAQGLDVPLTGGGLLVAKEPSPAALHVELCFL